MTDIGIVCAMSLEAAALTRLPTPDGQVVRISEHCLLVCAGVGPERAYNAALTLPQHGVSAVLSWGCAAGLQPAARAGTLVLPGAVLTEDEQRITVDNGLQSALLQRFARCQQVNAGELLSVAAPVATRAQKTTLHQRYGAVALDMESAAIGRAAHRCQLPFAAVRAIVDPATQTLPGMAINGLQADGSFNLGKGLTALAQRPLDIIAMIHLAYNAYLARHTLRLAATDLIAAPLT